MEFATGDVQRFYRLFDAADGAPTAAALDSEYLARGSEALHEFAAMRSISGASLRAAILEKRPLYLRARSCAASLPEVEAHLAIVLRNLHELYPPAIDAPVTFLIGRGSTGGTTNRAGVLMGLETVCSMTRPSRRAAGLVHLVAHEFAHVQQPAAQTEPRHPTLLYAALVEGGAELVAMLTSGDTGNSGLRRWAAGREQEVEIEFLRDMHSTDLRRWLWNGRGTSERPGDLGYWVGYRIAKSYFEHSSNKKQAIADIIRLANPEDLLRRSGWRPGIRLAPLSKAESQSKRVWTR